MSTIWTQEHVDAFNAKKGKLPSKIPVIPAVNSGKAGNSVRKSGNSAHIPKMSANTLTKHALRILDLKGWDVWRQNNGGVYDPTRKVFRQGSSTPGISDIIGFHKKTGQFIACEVKVGKDKLSDEQRIFLQRVARAGGIGIECRKIEDLDQVPGIPGNTWKR